MKTYHSFKDVASFQKFLRTKEWKSGELDYVKVNKIVFTMHEYDSSGHNMSWANKKRDMLIDCNTSDRYGRIGFRDAELSLYENYGLLRDDISYAE
jgi:hypothetical protein